MNDFAKSQLMKYGWTEGKGLGKNENGIKEALKPKLKFDTAGVGHKDIDWNNWWETAFNKATNSIIVDTQTHGVSISVANESTTNDLSKEDLNKKSKYGNFLKTSTLVNGNLIKESNVNVSKIEDIKKDITHIPLTDEELFKVCGGRTAHKGARHGITLNGKLNRIAKQEQDLLSTSAYVHTTEKFQNNNKKSQTDKSKINNNENTVLPKLCFIDEYPEISKNAKKKTKKCINKLSHQLNVLCNVSDNYVKDTHNLDNKIPEKDLEKKDKIRKRKRDEQWRRNSMSCDNVERTETEEADNEFNVMVHPLHLKLEKVLKRKMQTQTNVYPNRVLDDVFRCIKKKKKSKKKKYQDYQFDVNIVNTYEDNELGSFQAKRVKKIEESIFVHVAGDECIKLLDCPSDPERHSNEHKRSKDRIPKRKKTKLKKNKKKKHKNKVDKITESLKAVHFNTEESLENKNTKNKIEIVAKNIMASDVATDKTELLKKKKKKV